MTMAFLSSYIVLAPKIIGFNILEEKTNLQIRIHAVYQQDERNQNKSQEDDGKNLDDGKQDRDIACCTKDFEAGRNERRYLFERSVDLAGVRYTHLGR